MPEEKQHTRPRGRPENRPIIRILQAVNVCISRMYHRLTVLAPQRLPRSGAAILVCNHISGLDPMLLQSVCPRMVTWMMAKEYYNVRGLGWVFRKIGVIPVERSGRDLSSTRAAMRALSDGGVLGIFPEGRIEMTAELLPFQTGAAMLALKTGVAVFPAAIEGTQHGIDSMLPVYLKPQQAMIAFGEPIRLPPRKHPAGDSPDFQSVTNTIQEAVRRLRQRYMPGGFGKNRKKFAL